MPADNQRTMRQALFPFRYVVCAPLLLFCLTSETVANLYTFQGEGGGAYFTNVQGEGRTKVRFSLQAAAYPHRTARQGKQPNFQRGYEPVIASASHRFAVDPDLVRAVIEAESNFNPYAVSPKGAQGLMQIMPLTASEMGVVDPFDPVENIHGGVKYLRYLLDLFREDYGLALAAYNAGPSRVLNGHRIPPIAETQEYVKRVLEYFRLMKN
jgi:soluble lytic murein transglycosylase-like protein